MSKKATIAPMLGAILTAAPPRPSDRQMVKEHARMQKRHATQDWVAGRMSTRDHNAIHARADHVLSGKHPRAFNGPTGSGRKIRGYDAGL